MVKKLFTFFLPIFLLMSLIDTSRLFEKGSCCGTEMCHKQLSCCEQDSSERPVPPLGSAMPQFDAPLQDVSESFDIADHRPLPTSFTALPVTPPKASFSIIHKALLI